MNYQYNIGRIRAEIVSIKDEIKETRKRIARIEPRLRLAAIREALAVVKEYIQQWKTLQRLNNILMILEVKQLLEALQD